jgi:integrase
VTKLKLKYIQVFRDRHGKVRHYFRKPGSARIALPGLPGSAEFMDAYQRGLEGIASEEIVSKRALPGTLHSLIVRYYGSSEFTTLSASTQRTYRGIVEGFRANHGDKRTVALEAHHIRAILDAKAGTPAAANNLLKLLRVLMRFAVERGLRNDDPTIHIRKVRSSTTGFHSWSDAEISQFVAYHKPGTRAHLAMSLLLYTAQRRSDVITMGWQHVRDNGIAVTQQKTKTPLQIPIHKELRAALDATERKNMTFLVTAYGKPFTAAGFTNWFRDCVREAKLPDGCSPHGLRKAASRRLAEAGCSAHMIMSITGHKSLKEVVVYTAAANQEQLAKSAMATI